MYTSTIVKKQKVNGILEVTVSFTDGTNTVIKTVKPQDERGFYHWLGAEIESLNTAEKLETDLVEGQPVTVPEPVTQTQAELDKQAWFAKYFELEQLEKIAEKNFLTGAKLTALNNKITTVKNYLDANAKVEYLNFV